MVTGNVSEDARAIRRAVKHRAPHGGPVRISAKTQATVNALAQLGEDYRVQMGDGEAVVERLSLEERRAIREARRKAKEDARKKEQEIRRLARERARAEKKAAKKAPRR